MKLVICILFVFLVSSCMQLPPLKQERSLGVVYVNRWQNDYKTEKLKECKQESIIMTIAIFEANPHMTEEDVERMEKFMLDGCSKHFGLTI